MTTQRAPFDGLSGEVVDLITRTAIKRIDAQIRALRIERKALLGTKRKRCPKCRAQGRPFTKRAEALAFAHSQVPNLPAFDPVI